MSLKEKLDSLTEENKSRIPAQAAAVMKDAHEELMRSGIQTRALKPGDPAKDFSLPNAHGKPVSLTSLLRDGPVVITFYRGAWCPYCNLTLKALQEALPEIEEARGKLVAISPQNPDASLSTVEKNELRFEVLSDSGNKVAKSYGIAFALQKGVSEIYKSFGIDLQKSNGTAEEELPLAATFIIGTDERIRYAYVDTDYKRRMEPQDIVSILKQLKMESASTR